MSLFAQQLNASSSDRGTLVFLHGGGVSSWSWRPVAALLPEYASLLVDLPEHGESAEIGPFTMQLAGLEVSKLVNERARGNAHFIGLSLGAQLTIQLLATDPALVSSAFVTGCSVRPIPMLGNQYFLKALFSLYAPFQNMPGLVRLNARAMGVPKANEGDFANDTRSMSPTRLARIVAESQSFRIPRGLAGNATRAFIAVGSREVSSIKKSAMDLHRALPRSNAYEVSGKSHGWPLQDPRLCADAIRAFLTDRPIPDHFVRRIV